MQKLNKVLTLLEKQNVFLTGGAGVGKSYLAKNIINKYKDNFKQVVALGSTGVSAVNIGGQTCHSFFVLGISSNFEELKSYDKSSKRRLKELYEILKKTDLIVIDEISMVGANLLEMIHYRLRSAGYDGRVLFVGDFFQLPPVVKKEQSDLFANALYAFESDAWGVLDPAVVILDKMMRTEDAFFTKILQKIRSGVCDEEVIEYLEGLRENTKEYQNKPTFLYGTNYEAETTNRSNLNKLKGEEIVLLADEEIKEKSSSSKKVESWKKMLPVTLELKLKVGVPILFTTNKKGKFYNGERGRVKAIADEYILVEKEGRDVRVQKQDFDMIRYESGDGGEIEEKVTATISQYPIKLAYAITIHKSQGMSIKDLVCNVDRIFAPSQFYVAISRAIDPKALVIEYSGYNFEAFLKKIINVSERVKGFYGTKEL